MRRIKLVLGALAVVVAMLAASAAPAMAHDNHHVFRNDGGRFFFDNGRNGVFLVNGGGIDNGFFPFGFGFPGFRAFDNINGFGGDHNFVIQRVG